jgi:deoxyribonuclease V
MIPHRWDMTPTEAVALQRELAGLVVQTPVKHEVRTIAGIDCAFADGGKRILAAAVLCEAGTMEILERAEVDQPCRFPYVSGLLSFREAPAILEAIAALPHQPDLVMCDGQGIAHPRGLGLAAHVGLWLTCPTIGVAKSRLCGEHRTPGLRRGSRTQLKVGSEVVGAVVRTRDDVRPLYVSPGNRITIEESIRWVLRCGRGVRLPEPTRQADRLVGEMKRRR